jgi:hypothetical protein
MKQNRKQKPDEGAGFDDAGHVEQTTNFDDLAATLGLLGITLDQLATHTKADATRLLKSKGLPQDEIAELLRGVSLDDPEREREAQAKVASWASPERRAQVEAGLQRLGFTPNEQAVVLAMYCDKLGTDAAVARATKRDRKTVKAIRNRQRVREVLKRLQSGEPLPTQDTPYRGTPTKGLHLVNCDNNARAFLRMTGTDNIGVFARLQWAQRHNLPPETAGWPDFLRFLNSDQLTPQHVVELVKAHPPLLLYPGCEPLREAFVGLLLAGNYGASQIGRTSAIPQGKPHTVKAQARKVLELLNRWPKGYAFPDEPLAEVVGFYRQRIVELREAFGPGMSDERLAKFRKEHAYEFDGYTDRELRELLSKGNDPLKLAARYAGKVADMTPAAFAKAYRRVKPSG